MRRRWWSVTAVLAAAIGAVAVAALVVALAAGTGGTGNTGNTDNTRATGSTDGTGPGPGEMVVSLEPVASVERPTAMAVRAGDDALYVATQAGLVVAVRGGAAPDTVLDLTARTQATGERGLLGLAFSPDGERLYVHYTSRGDGGTVLEQYAFADGEADPGSRRTILTVRQPQSNHNGGPVVFGPDGYLYLGLGDGGSFSDRGSGHAPGGNGQSLDTLLGKILRIDPEGSRSGPYAIPTDNPFVDGDGRPEIYVYGLRNPWRLSFDRETGDLWVADVGESRVEEVTRLEAGRIAGANLGWNVFEGTRRFRSGSADDVVMPQIEVGHDEGDCAITGGYVYRGARIPSLAGSYVFTDYCNGSIRAVEVDEAGTVHERELGIEASSVASFGEDHDGELYVLSQRDGVFRIVSRPGG